MGIIEIKADESNSRFVIEPLEKGSAVIIGNVLKEIMESYLLNSTITGHIVTGRKDKLPKGIIAVNLTAKPVEAVELSVDSYLLCEIKPCERLIMDVCTNGTLTPKAAITLSASLLDSYVKEFLGNIQSAKIVEGEEEREWLLKERLIDKHIEELQLSVRAYNVLRRNGIQTIRQLTTKSESELLAFRNMGKKSAEEIIEKMVTMGLALRSDNKENE